MKTTKLILLLFFFLILLHPLYSQRYAITGGINFANMEITGIDTVNPEKLVFRTGYKLGTCMELSMSDMFAFEPGITLSVKGYNYKSEFLSRPLAQKLNVLYLEAPLNMKITWEWGNYKIFGLLGPYGSLAIKGKTKTDYWGQSEQLPIQIGDDKKFAEVRSLDYGVSVGAGMEIDKASFRVSYSYGMMNVSPRASLGESMENRVLSVYFVYFFSNYYHHKKYKY